MNTSKGYKRWMSVGCSHGDLADDDATRAVLKFKRIWNPHMVIHHGDYIDMAAFRGGAKGTSDECVPVENDLKKGIQFLRKLRPNVIINGNHENRLWKDMNHPNAIVARAASSVVNEIRELAVSLKAHHIEHYDITRSWYQLGNFRFIHGFGMGGMNGLKEMGEHFGNVVCAHLHVAEEVAIRRAEPTRAYCVGTLANVPSMGYALGRRATARWSHGFAWGEYNDRDCRVWISQCAAGQAAFWRLPI